MHEQCPDSPESPLGKKQGLDVKPDQMDGMVGTLGLTSGFRCHTECMILFSHTDNVTV